MGVDGRTRGARRFVRRRCRDREHGHAGQARRRARRPRGHRPGYGRRRRCVLLPQRAARTLRARRARRHVPPVHPREHADVRGPSRAW